MVKLRAAAAVTPGPVSSSASYKTCFPGVHLLLHPGAHTQRSVSRSESIHHWVRAAVREVIHRNFSSLPVQRHLMMVEVEQ